MKNLNIYKSLALLGILLMGIGSFMSCLASSEKIATIGTVILCISIVVSVIGFSKWQP